MTDTNYPNKLLKKIETTEEISEEMTKWQVNICYKSAKHLKQKKLLVYIKSITGKIQAYYTFYKHTITDV